MSIDPNNLAGTAHQTFDDEFSNLSLWSPSNPSGTWATTFWYQDPNGNGGSLTSNGEQEWYINANYGPTAGVQPWTANNGVLTLTATPTPSWVSGQVNNYSYVSGELNTYHSFSQTYGYFEMRAQLPSGQGFWPAFWLMPESGAWPPELDVMEVLGQNPELLFTSVHTGSNNTVYNQANVVPDTSAGYHTYGVDWEPDYITFYFDGQKVFQTATPSDMNQPMYMIANLAVGGYWPGSANGYSSAQMNVDYIRAYASGPSSSGSSGSSSGGSSSGGSTSGGSTGGSGAGGSSSAVTVSDANYTAPSGVTSITLSGWSQTIQANNAGDTFYSDNSQNHLLGGTGNDTFYLGRAGDNAVSGGGTDTFVFNQVPWAGGHIAGFSGQDALELPFLQAYGYGGANPLADGRVQLVSDGQGGTQVWAHLDGLNGVSGTWLVTTLDGIAPSSLAWSNGALVDPPGGTSGGSTGSSSGSGGQTFTSDNNGDHWTGTAGNDVFNLGRGGDVVSGAGGADAFKLAQVPWAHAEITDFGGQDVLDLSAMFANVGYTGSNPLADGHLKFVSDGNGGAQVWFDTDGLPIGVGGNWEIAVLDHVAPSSLTISNGVITLSGSAGSGGSSSGSSAGQTFVSNDAGDHWTGTAGNDTFEVGRGGDVLTGNGGADTFTFSQVPWAHAEITDWSAQDTIDLGPMFANLGYSTSNPVADGRLSLVDDGAGNTQVWFNASGLPYGSGGSWQLAQLDHVAASTLHVNGAFITG